MPLASFDVLVGVVTAWVSRFLDGFDALGVDDACRRLRILAHPLPLVGMQDFEDEMP
jgi:hypothetical protein